jgi:hypothetical protein
MADLNVLAFALTHARRLPEAAEAFRRIGLHMTMYPWDIAPDPVETFLYWDARHARG